MTSILKKEISAPIAIGIILVLAVLAGAFTLWQYSEIKKEDFSEEELNIPEGDKEEIFIFSPAEGEKWAVGENHVIKWLPNTSPEKFGIILQDERYSTASLSKVWQIENIETTGFYSFTVPELESGDEYRFYISSRDREGYSELFSIEPLPQDWRVYEWHNSLGSFSFRYPPDWTVERIYYQTPAQQAKGEIPENIGLLLSPNKGLDEVHDYVSVGGRQEGCGIPNKKYTMCFTVEIFPIYTYSNNPEVLSIFDAVAESLFRITE